jgi:hypothetical protein
LIASTIGMIRFISRSFLLPKILVKKSHIIC